MVVALDTEGSGLHVDDGARVSIVSLAWEGESRVYAFDQGVDTWLGPKWGTPKKFKGRSLFDDEFPNLGLQEWYELCQWVSKQDLVFHNGKYDMQIMAAGLRGMPETGIDLQGACIWDTMVVCPLLWPNERVALKAVSAVNWGEGETEEQGRLQKWLKKNCGAKDKRYDLVPWDVIGPYAEKDAVLTYRLWKLQIRLIEEGRTDWVSVDRELDLMMVLYNMERAGIGWDTERALQVQKELYQRSRALSAELASVVGITHTPTGHDMARFWFEQLGIPVMKETAGGEASIALDVVRELVKNEVQGAALWQELNKINTSLSMWYTAWTNMCGQDGRLRTSYRQLKSEADLRESAGGMKGTVSSRLAVERIQLQAIPHFYQMPTGVSHTVRSLFIPKPGHSLWELDLSQAEMRGVAGLAGCVNLISAFEAGEDAHDTTCRLVFKIDKGHPDWESRRAIAKRLNFAIVYGAGIDTLVFQIKLFTGQDVTHDQASRWWDDTKAVMPEVFHYSSKCKRLVDRRRYLELVGGKLRHFGPLEFSHKAMNAMVQGSVAVAMADAMIEVQVQHGPGLMLLQIHDSLVLEPKIELEQEKVDSVKSIMSNVFEGHFGVPFRVDSKPFGLAGEKKAA